MEEDKATKITGSDTPSRNRTLGCYVKSRVLELSLYDLIASLIDPRLTKLRTLNQEMLIVVETGMMILRYRYRAVLLPITQRFDRGFNHTRSLD